jgi:dTDP-glucose 4,6-dehydratase
MTEKAAPGALLVTGGCGFIGSNFVRLARRLRPELPIVVLDKLTYAGNLENLEGIVDGRQVRFERGDVSDAERVREVLALDVDRVIHFAAESHVDRSIEDATAFLATNVVGTQVLLDAARHAGVRRFVQVSTDEVYGSIPAGLSARPDSPLAPSSPYSASKAAADLLVLAARHTHGMDVVITRASNNYGPYQFPEKLVPLMISCALADRTLPVYGDGLQVRDWIHVEDHCEGLLAALERGEAGRILHFGSGREHTNLDVVRLILRRLSKPESLIAHVTDRPGHDRRYALDIDATSRELGWAPRRPLAEGLAETVDWYARHRTWWETIVSGEYRHYYERMYGRRETLAP